MSVRLARINVNRDASRFTTSPKIRGLEIGEAEGLTQLHDVEPSIL